MDSSSVAASPTSNSLQINWQESAYQLWAEGKYSEIASFYEQAIAIESNIKTHYWHLGLAYLLQGYEEEAQVTWMSAMVECSSEELEQWTEELVQILEIEAQRQTASHNFQVSWLIRQHIREIAPTHINNLLQLIQLAIDLEDFHPDYLNHWQVATTLQQYTQKINSDLLLQVLQKLLDFPSPEVIEFTEACLPHQPEDASVFLEIIISYAIKIAYKLGRPDLAIPLTEVCLKIKPERIDILRHLSSFYSDVKAHQQAIETAKRFYEKCPTPLWQVQGSCAVLRALMCAGSWLEVEPAAQHHKSLVMNIVQNPPESIELTFTTRLLTSNFFLPYLQDRPRENRWLHNQTARLFQTSLKGYNSSAIDLFQNHDRKVTRQLKIGYIAHILKGHSVGWLCRWLFNYYDRESFQTHVYLMYQDLEDIEWFQKKVDSVHSFGADPKAMATKIKEDKIDILVDLDSLTLDITCLVMAMKSAPVQVSWLGWDASGIPAIDYFIADPYVLPDNAQEYYQETIWRLPHTYVAVDGFEVDIPTLRREQLEIPIDAIIYLSAQSGYKYHFDTVRLQMQILKQVPNSYLLIKGMAGETALQEFFKHVAESEGINPNRLRFLPRDPNEFVHRANLGIADVVLDTYPYNGATTTLETLWVGVPLVTRVGQQFSARNSYGFMMNVGVTEGIAWTDEEYVEWGVRLGKDASLRQQIAWKLRQSRQTSPLWNAKQFIQEMEKAYKQMWQRYVEVNFV